MLLTISTTHTPATDLGFLLHKHPDRVQQFDQSVGTAHVFYPEASDDRCTAALLLDVDPVRLARSRGKQRTDVALAQYVNDRSYAASSLLSVAMGKVFSSARAGVCKSHQDLADAAIPLEIELPVLPCRGGAEMAVRLFAPLGWHVEATPIPLDERFSGWGDSRYVHLRLTGTVRLADALNHLYVLLPVLDEAKHYWQGTDEVDKLMRSGAGWLAEHPEAELITRRYLGRSRDLTRSGLARLAELADTPADEATQSQAAPHRAPLAAQRADAVAAAVLASGATSVIDLGCGGGQLLARFVDHGQLTRITGTDVSTQALAVAEKRLHLGEDATERRTDRISLFQAALTYEDDRLAGYDAAVLMEVIEHVDPPRLAALERVVLGAARPATVVVTTPNADYNVVYEHLDGMRHPDHRFEWTRAEFADWVARVAATYGYEAGPGAITGIGDEHEAYGHPTQMAVLTRARADQQQADQQQGEETR